MAKHSDEKQDKKLINKIVKKDVKPDALKKNAPVKKGKK